MTLTCALAGGPLAGVSFTLELDMAEALLQQPADALNIIFGNDLPLNVPARDSDDEDEPLLGGVYQWTGSSDRGAFTLEWSGGA